MAGGAANLSWVFHGDTFTIERGNPKCFKADSDSGGTFFCDNCGVQMFSRPDSDPQLVAIKVGALDDAIGFAVEADIWMNSAPSWHQPHIDALQFGENLPANSK